MKLTVREIAVFGMLGALMYASKVAMEALPNIHLLGVFTVALTVVYRQKALYPIYIYVILCGLFSGFASWWIPHLYLWLVLWGITMLLPKRLPKAAAPFVYAAVCGLHGFLYGVLYAPSQALLYGLNFEAMVTWIIAGIPYDIVHGISNLVGGILICPIIAVLRRAETAG
ncbi:MAG: hypothetical protein E7553_07235 [Ruminococcaceae bacterium]|nr:hypothetical protein [Oscillospiraceae bacterium]